MHFRLFRRFEEQIEKALHLFHNWGTWAIFIGRFMGPFRATVPLVAGMSELEFWPFMVANAASAVIWAYVLLAPGAAILRRVGLWLDDIGYEPDMCEACGGEQAHDGQHQEKRVKSSGCI